MFFFIMKVDAAITNLKSIKASGDVANVGSALANLITEAEAVLSEWLDVLKGHKLSNNEIFTKLARQYEDEFNKDMEALNVCTFIFFVSNSDLFLF